VQFGDSGPLEGYVVARRHGDFRMERGVEQRIQVEYGWDYARRMAFRIVRDTNGVVIDRAALVGADLPLTPRESARVEWLVRTHPAIAPLLGASDVRIWSGGFVYRKPGDLHCDRGSRCVHAIVAADHGSREIAHAIVDLQSDRVVDPFYGALGAKGKEHAD